MGQRKCQNGTGTSVLPLRSVVGGWVTNLFDMGDVSNPKGDGINVKLVVIEGKLLSISHHPRQTWSAQTQTQQTWKLHLNQPIPLYCRQVLIRIRGHRMGTKEAILSGPHCREGLLPAWMPRPSAFCLPTLSISLLMSQTTALDGTGPSPVPAEVSGSGCCQDGACTERAALRLCFSCWKRTYSRKRKAMSPGKGGVEDD